MHTAGETTDDAKKNAGRHTCTQTHDTNTVYAMGQGTTEQVVCSRKPQARKEPNGQGGGLEQGP